MPAESDPSEPCPRCGLAIHADDPVEGVNGGAKHATSTVTDRDGCIAALGREVRELRAALQEHGRDHPRPRRLYR